MTIEDTHTTPPANPSRALHITLWVLQILLAAFFLLAAAIPKLLGDQAAVEGFDIIGLGQWFRYFVGVLELAGAVGLLLPRLAGLAALGLAGVMVGATITNIFVFHDGSATAITVALFILLCLVAWGRSRTKALKT